HRRGEAAELQGELEAAALAQRLEVLAARLAHRRPPALPAARLDDQAPHLGRLAGDRQAGLEIEAHAPNFCSRPAWARSSASSARDGKVPRWPAVAQTSSKRSHGSEKTVERPWPCGPASSSGTGWKLWA